MKEIFRDTGSFVLLNVVVILAFLGGVVVGPDIAGSVLGITSDYELGLASVIGGPVAHVIAMLAFKLWWTPE